MLLNPQMAGIRKRFIVKELPKFIGKFGMTFAAIMGVGGVLRCIDF